MLLHDQNHNNNSETRNKEEKQEKETWLKMTNDLLCIFYVTAHVHPQLHLTSVTPTAVAIFRTA